MFCCVVLVLCYSVLVVSCLVDEFSVYCTYIMYSTLKIVSIIRLKPKTIRIIHIKVGWRGSSVSVQLFPMGETDEASI